MKEKFYLTTAIAYTSSKPHIGNVFEIVLTDAIARFRRMQGYDVFFLTGTDEHGIKIQQKAEAKGVTPKQYVDEVAGEIRRMWDLFGASYDKFIRTTDQYHEKVVSKIFTKLYEQGDIYKSSYEGWYCTPCESFWTESQAVDGCCPDCGAKLSLNVSSGYRYFRCSGYKRNSRKKACSIHYIRESVLEQLVLKQLRQFLAYLQQFERTFVKLQIDSSIAEREYELYQKEQRLEQLKRRTVEIERLFRKIYEDNANGKITDEQFYRLSEGYEAELADAKTVIDTLTGELKDTDTAVTNVEKLIAVTRRYTRIDELTPEILNALVDKIVVHEAEKKDGKRTQSIDIYYSYVGIVNIPTAEEMAAHTAKQTASKTA